VLVAIKKEGNPCKRSLVMQIGVVSDAHGYLVGLKAALDWLAKEGTDMIVCAGDVANFGPQPNECISLLIGARYC
jgi:Icc-related predicted phosphoesterase